MASFKDNRKTRDTDLDTALSAAGIPGGLLNRRQEGLNNVVALTGSTFSGLANMKNEFSQKVAANPATRDFFTALTQDVTATGPSVPVGPRGKGPSAPVLRT